MYFGWRDFDGYVYHEDNPYEPLITEFEAFSSNFKSHGHDEKDAI